MKRLFHYGVLTVFLIAGAAGLVFGATAVPDTLVKAPRVPWIKDQAWTEIVELASTNEQPVLIDFTAHWCGPCRLLDVMVFNEREVINELAEVVTFQVDVDKPEFASVKRDFAVKVMPTVIWCDSSGREIDRFTGYRSSDEFLEIVRSWRKNRTIDRMLADRKARSPEDPAMLLDLARRHVERGEDRQAAKLFLEGAELGLRGLQYISVDEILPRERLLSRRRGCLFSGRGGG